MSIGRRIATGWALTKQSLHVLMLDKELLLFPVMSMIAAIAVSASFLVPLWMGGYVEALGRSDQAPSDPLVYVLVFSFYFANYFVMVFFNVAIVACALKRLRGGDPTVGDGVSAAVALLPKIFAWALLSATVGFILRLVEARVEGLGRLVTGLVGAAWSVATYFVVPVLVVERVGPFEALKRSAQVLRRSWGEAMVSRVGMGFVMFGAVLVATIPAAAGAMIGAPAALATGVTISVALWIVIMAASAALQGILVAALYQFAADGAVPEGFDQALLQTAFGPKRAR